MNGNVIWLFPFICSSGAALQMTGPSTYKATVGSTAHIPCTFTDDKLPADPRFFAVFWYLREKVIISYNNIVISTDPRCSLDEGQALDGNADLTISNPSVSDGGEYTCSVTYSPFRVEKRIRVDIIAKPKVIISNQVVTMDTESILHSVVSGFYPAKINIKWFRDGEMLNNAAVEEPQKDPNGTFSVRSSVTITPTEEDREKIFCSRVQHESLTSPLQVDFRLVYGARPLLSIPKMSVQRNTENSLTCMASGFFPKDITITWYKDGEPLKDQLMGDPQKNDNGTYQVTSAVKITPSDDDRNKTFSCRVHHLSLGDPLQENFLLIYEESSPVLPVFLYIIIALLVIIVIGITAIILKQKCKKGRPPDPEMRDIEVPELIAGKVATLECRISHYVIGEHNVIWSVKRKSSDQIHPAKSDYRIPSIKDKSRADAHIAKLTLSPVQTSDDGSEFFCKVNVLGSERCIERRTGPVHVRERSRAFRDENEPPCSEDVEVEHTNRSSSEEEPHHVEESANMEAEELIPPYLEDDPELSMEMEKGGWCLISRRGGGGTSHEIETGEVTADPSRVTH